MLIDGSTVQQNLKEHFDVAVIGSGAGGAVVAKELAGGGMKVAILEEGNYWKSTDHTDHAFESIARMYRDRGFSSTIGKPCIVLPLGKTFGGTTVINSGTCFRAPSKVFHRWNQSLGLAELSEENFAPLYDRVEKEIHVEESDFKVMGRANVIFHELLAKRGVRGRPLRRNIIKCEGCGFCCYGCPSGAKQSMEQNYLPHALSFGAKAFTNCKVNTLHKNGNTVTGLKAEFYNLEGHTTGYTLEIIADKVIVACGATLTPSLLQANGIAKKNKNLGRNLTIHPATKLFAKFDEEVKPWEGTPQAYYVDIFENEGILLEGISLPPDVIAANVPFVGNRMNEFMRDYKHMAAFGVLISDSSMGRVMRLPFIGTTVFYDLLQKDVEKIKKGCVYIARVFFEGGAKKVFTPIHNHYELQSLADVDKMEQAKILPEDIEAIAFHPLGSCRMGTSEKTGVVGTDYKVFGWEGIYLCDGSVIPSAIGVNPQETIMAFATRLAFQLLGKNVKNLA